MGPGISPSRSWSQGPPSIVSGVPRAWSQGAGEHGVRGPSVLGLRGPKLGFSGHLELGHRGPPVFVSGLSELGFAPPPGLVSGGTPDFSLPGCPDQVGPRVGVPREGRGPSKAASDPLDRILATPLGGDPRWWARV